MKNACYKFSVIIFMFSFIFSESKILYERARHFKIGRFSSSREIDMDPNKVKLVEDTIGSDFVVIFSKSYCPYCKLAKEVFDKVNQKYTCMELNERDDGDVIQDILMDKTGARSVPRVFVGGKCVGGGSDVKALHESGELEKLLAKK